MNKRIYVQTDWLILLKQGMQGGRTNFLAELTVKLKNTSVDNVTHGN